MLMKRMQKLVISRKKKPNGRCQWRWCGWYSTACHSNPCYASNTILFSFAMLHPKPFRLAEWSELILVKWANVNCVMSGCCETSHMQSKISFLYPSWLEKKKSSTAMHNPHFCSHPKTLGIGWGKNGYASGYSNNNSSRGTLSCGLYWFPLKNDTEVKHMGPDKCQHRCCFHGRHTSRLNLHWIDIRTSAGARAAQWKGLPVWLFHCQSLKPP